MVKIFKGVPYTGTLPAVLTGTKAGYLHKYKIYGNLSQHGTPTPENPIVPSECGERTGNLLNKIGAQPGYITYDGTVVSEHANLMYTDYIPVSDDVTSLTQSYDRNALVMGAPAMCFYDESKTYISGVAFSQAYTKTFQKPPNAKYIRTCYRTTMDWVMLNAGSTALPYEPYGYKLPLLSGSTPVDIYLGEVQTTRRIKKLMLTGGESWGKSSSRTGSFYLNIGTNAIAALGLCDRAVNVGTVEQYDSIGKMFVESSSQLRVLNVWLFDTNLSLADFKTYLAQQYAAGTPVTVWYVLATEKTGTLNEPLRKIGDYADTIDSTQTSAQIPTSANSTTISWAGQGLAPSEFDSIQEWVDTPTYKRVNGEWVADN